MRFSRIRCVFTTHLGHFSASSAYQRTLLYVDTLRPRLRATPERSQLTPLPPAADQNPPSIAKTTRARGARFNLEAWEAVYTGVFPSGIARVQVYRESAARFNNNRVLSATSFLVNQIRRLGAATNLIGERTMRYFHRARLDLVPLSHFHIGNFRRRLTDDRIFLIFSINIPGVSIKITIS